MANQTKDLSVLNADQPNAHSVSFSNSAERNNWIIVNDTVMGGRSRATLTIEDEFLVFAGDLSLENNGGFASVRRVYDNRSWVDELIFELVLQGDGREYQFRLRTDRNVDGIAYVSQFKTKAGEKERIQFKLSDFTPQFRGRVLQNVAPLAFSDVNQLGIMIADKTPGRFRLALHSISQVE